ncbi:hypothetical protein CWI75_02820 [Kineobactrum sediminis]|uniref:PilZ domain-containing protein n=1 Tax=Kineobactrum sediminis TaxID=1905677 RepID=A0A2N5Y7C5_9GAMM|nr:PilZ domain-containing protein [Kineobactrum sediminis]PLW84290.1 hypothetical protein CWI75_02820 [Kineobactrum sediminis]
MNGINDRRRYYRINDTVLLRYGAITGGQTPAESTDLGAGILLGKSDRDLNDAIEHVAQRDPVIAQAMELLNRKISALATQLLAADELNGESYDKAQVNLSGCGIAFEARGTWLVGERLRIGILINSAREPVDLLGTIISIEDGESANESCRLRVDFDENEHSQDQIIQYVIQRQGALLSDSLKSRAN